MNFMEAWEILTASEKLMFQNCCRKLLRRTFIVKDKNEDRKHYFFILKYIDGFINYFSYMGFDVKFDKNVGVIMLDNLFGMSDREKLFSNRNNFTKEETIVLCCLWLVYISRMKEGILTSKIVIGISDLIYELEKYGARDMINKSSYNSIFRVFKNYSLIDIDGNIGDVDCKILLYPSLQFVLEASEFERFVNEVVEVVLAEKDSLEVDEDEESVDEGE